VFIALSPKSDSVGRAYSAALADVIRLGSLPVPNHLRTAGDRRMKAHGIGVGYQFPHDFEGDDIQQQYLPDELVDRRYYVPNDQGHEVAIAARMAERASGRAVKPRRKSRPTPPMASMSDAIKPSMESRKKLAETQKKDAGA
jgi:putative ATPase